MYDAADQTSYVTAPGQPAVNYTYDDNGNLTRRAVTTVAVGGVAEAPEKATTTSHGNSGPALAVLIVAGGLVVAVVTVISWRARRRGPIVMLLVLLTVPLLAEQQATKTQAAPPATLPSTDTFSYDHENRLVAANIGGVASAYSYNGDGLRVNRTIAGTTSNYVWDTGSALPEVLQDTSGGQTTYYVYGLDLIASIQGTTPTYYITDGLGSTTELANSTGAVIGEYAYDVFGTVRNHSDATTDWSFTGEQNDANGLEYLRARYYEPASGRFLTRDPFGGFATNGQSLNRYAYALNNPTLLSDPLGLQGGTEVMVLEGGGMVVCSSTGGCILIAAGIAGAWCLLDSSCRTGAADALTGLGDIGSDVIGGIGDVLGDLPGPFRPETRQASPPPPTFNGRGPGGGPSWNPFGDFGKIPGVAKAALGMIATAIIAEKTGLADIIADLLRGSSVRDDGKESKYAP